MTNDNKIEWPREIWMAERDDHDQGVVSAVLSEHATVARFEADKERDREFHRYVDGDIYDSAEKYHRTLLDEAKAERDVYKARVDHLQSTVTALTNAEATARCDALEEALSCIEKIRALTCEPKPSTVSHNHHRARGGYTGGV